MTHAEAVSMVRLIMMRSIGVWNVGQIAAIEAETAERWIRYGYAMRA